MSIANIRGEMMKRRLPEVLTPEETKRLLATPNRRYRTGNTQYLTMRLSLETGMRISELTNLKRKDINFLTGKTLIKISKNKKDRTSWISIETREELLKYWEMIGESKYCFSNLSGEKLLNSNLRRSIKKKGGRCGIERIHYHLLRHTSLTNIYTEKKDIRLVQQIAGHQSINTTMIYTAISGELIKDTLLTNTYN